MSFSVWVKKLIWPGPDFGKRDRYSLRKFLLTGPNIEMSEQNGQLFDQINHHIHFESLNRFENGGHARHGYDFTSLQKLLEDNGFEILDQRGVGYLSYVMGFKAISKFRRLPGLLGQSLTVMGFFILFKFVKSINLLSCKPWFLYFLACKK